MVRTCASSGSSSTTARTSRPRRRGGSRTGRRRKGGAPASSSAPRSTGWSRRGCGRRRRTAAASPATSRCTRTTRRDGSRPHPPSNRWARCAAGAGGPRSRAVVAAVALAVRAIAVLVSDRVVADVLRYRKVAAHVLDVAWNPYLAPRLYPYPAAWVWVEVAAEWLARHTGVSFALAVKAPVVVADALLAGIILQWTRERGTARPRSAWAYALHPGAILVVGFHGQFDSVALLALICALRWLERGRLDRSALAFAAGIALKSFPVLVLPFALLFVPGDRRGRLPYAPLGPLPRALPLLPVPLAGLLGERFLAVHAAVATLALVGFYFFLAPGVLTPADTPLLGAAVAERCWMVGTAALWLICAAWTVDLVRRGRSAQ